MIEGNLSDVSLPGILQFLGTESNKSFKIKLVSGPSRGELFISEGVLLAANFGLLEGNDALTEFLFWKEGSFSIERLASRFKSTITANLKIELKQKSSFADQMLFLQAEAVGLNTEIVPSPNFGTQKWQELLAHQPLYKEDYAVLGWVTDGRTMRQAMREFNFDVVQATGSLFRLLITGSVETLRPGFMDQDFSADKDKPQAVGNSLPSGSQSISQTMPKPGSQTGSQSTSQTMPKPGSQTTSQSTSQTMSKPDSQSISQTISQSVSQTNIKAPGSGNVGGTASGVNDPSKKKPLELKKPVDKPAAASVKPEAGAKPDAESAKAQEAAKAAKLAEEVKAAEAAKAAEVAKAEALKAAKAKEEAKAIEAFKAAEAAKIIEAARAAEAAKSALLAKAFEEAQRKAEEERRAAEEQKRAAEAKKIAELAKAFEEAKSMPAETDTCESLPAVGSPEFIALMERQKKSEKKDAPSVGVGTEENLPAVGSSASRWDAVLAVSEGKRVVNEEPVPKEPEVRKTNFDIRRTDPLPLVAVDIERLFQTNFHVAPFGQIALNNEALDEDLREILSEFKQGMTFINVALKKGRSPGQVLHSCKYSLERGYLDPPDQVASLTADLLLGRLELEQYLLQRRRLTGDELRDVIDLAKQRGVKLTELLVKVGFMTETDWDRLVQEKERFAH